MKKTKGTEIDRKRKRERERDRERVREREREKERRCKWQEGVLTLHEKLKKNFGNSNYLPFLEEVT